MSKLRIRLASSNKLAEQKVKQMVGDVNAKLYNGENPEKGIKDTIIKFIESHMQFDVSSNVNEEEKQNLESPGTEASATIELDGALAIADLVSSFGEFKSDDLANLKSELENGDFQDVIKDTMNDSKDHKIKEFSVSTVITIDGSQIKVQSKAVNIDGYTKEDFDNN